MTRDGFMKELAYLLQDIQDEDKEDALQYYMDYFDEAGPEREDEVIRELGSPERIAAIIRSDIAGHLENGGEFTESGYQDERFRDPNYQVARRFDLPERQEQEGRDNSKTDYSKTEPSQDWQDETGHGRDWQSGQQSHDPKHSRPQTSNTLKIILWVILIIIISPMLIGLGGGVLGIAGGLLGLLVGALVLIGVLTAAMLISGVAMIPFGIIHMFTQPLDGFFISGTGLILLGIGVLLLALAVLFYGRFLPFLIRSIVNTFNRLLHRGRCKS